MDRGNPRTRMLSGRFCLVQRVAGLVLGVVIVLSVSRDPTTAQTQQGTPGAVYDRQQHTTTLLADGRVLVAGGRDSVGSMRSAFLFDPVAGTWSATGSMAVARFGHAATLLRDGRVLVTGGSECRFNCTVRDSLASAELYDPSAGLWTPVAPMAATRVRHAAALLPDGRVLVAGGEGTGRETPPVGTSSLRSTEIYDAVTGLWSAAAPLHEGRQSAGVVVLADTRIAVLSGWEGSDRSVPFEQRPRPATDVWRTAELYDSATDTWTLTSQAPRQVDLGTWWTGLSDGRVLGLPRSNTEATAIYDPGSDTWTVQQLPQRNPNTNSLDVAAVVALADGRVLASGGDNRSSDGAADGVALFDAATATWTPTGSLLTGRQGHTAVSLADGRVLVFGGRQRRSEPPGNPVIVSRLVRTSEIYDPVTGRWTALDQPMAVTPSVDDDSCPVSEQTCDLVLQVGGWLRDGNVAAVAELVRTAPVICGTEEQNGSRGLSQICQDAQPGDRRTGYLVTAGEFGGYLSREQYEEALRTMVTSAAASSRDPLGSGEFRLAGFLCPTSSGAPNCANEGSVLFTWMQASDRDGAVRRFGLIFQIAPSPMTASPRLAGTAVELILPGYLDELLPWSPLESVP